MNTSPPLGYCSALRVIQLGRAAFFGADDFDLPTARSAEVAADDRTPQFGYIGSNYAHRRVLFLGINPGNGFREGRNAGDAAVMPALRAFCSNPTESNFLLAQRTYEAVCSGWRLWGTECQEVLEASGLTATDLAFTNALPYRAGKVSAFSKFVAINAARQYLSPYLSEIQPKIILGLGKKAAEILAFSEAAADTHHVVWNRARALKSGIRAEREAALTQLKQLLCKNAV